MLLSYRFQHVVINSDDLAGSRILGTQTIAAGVNRHMP